MLTPFLQQQPRLLDDFQCYLCWLLGECWNVWYIWYVLVVVIYIVMFALVLSLMIYIVDKGLMESSH
jgi:hypothetical protein